MTQVLVDGRGLVESPRWHDGRLWLCDWGTQEVLTVTPDGSAQTVARVAGLPICIDWLPDGRLLAVNGTQRLLLRQEPDGSLVTHADMTGLTDYPCNDIAVDGREHLFVNGIGFDFATGPSEDNPEPGIIMLVSDAGATVVAQGLAFPNGMVVTPDGSTLIVAESYRGQLTAFDIEADGSLTGRRVWAELGEAAPDGICLDAEGAVWYADVPHQRCVRVREGGEVLQTVDLDRGAFACALGGPDGQTLFIVAAAWPDAMTPGSRTGQVLAVTLD